MDGLLMDNVFLESSDLRTKVGESVDDKQPAKVQLPLSALTPGSPLEPQLARLEAEALGCATSPKLAGSPPGLPLADFPPGLVPPAGVPSHGSLLHASRNCRPCAWFWKPTGCQNGQHCGHCHLCPAGELKARKKVKQTVMRYGLATPKAPQEVDEDSAMMVNPFMFGTARWEPPMISELESTTCSGSEHDLVISSGSDQDMASPERGPGTLPAPSPLSAGGMPAAYSPTYGTMPWLRDMQCDTPAAHLQIPPGLQPPPNTPMNTPMTDMSSHIVGTCRPCAWYWKPGGCQNGINCNFCHMCPDGELKVRKKSKQAMLRLGLITPKSSMSTECDARYALSLAACI